MADQHFTEAPASINVKVTSPGGYEYLVTMRGFKVGELLDQAQKLEAWLGKHNWQPAKNGHSNGQHTAGGNGSVPAESAPLCAIHKTPMERRSKDGRSWWSCAHKLDTGEWCPYRPKAAS